MTADFAIKEPCRAATTANITLSGPQTIDGIALAAGDRVLVKAQSTASENGIYTAASGAWARATDFDASAEAIGGTQVLVTSGTLNAGSAWRIAGHGTITLGTTAIAFERAIDSDSVAFLQQGPGAVIRGAEAKLRDFINVLDFHDAADNDITDALETVIDTAAPGFDAIQIFVPEGQYGVSRQLIPSRPITLRGAGMYATELTFYDLEEEEVDDVFKGAISITETSNFSVIQDICIAIAEEGRPSGLDYCLWASARLFATNVRLMNGGLKVRAGGAMVGGGDPVAGVANNSVFQNVVSILAPEHAFFFNGSEVNACTIIGCTAIDMNEIGFWDASFLGNTYTGCCADGGAGGAVSAYKHSNVAGVNCSLFSGCYAESTFTGDVWAIETGGLILQPQGILPEPIGSLGNPTFASAESSGLWGNVPLTMTPRKQDAFTIGDATNKAACFHANGLHIRDRDGNLNQFTAAADGSMLLKANFPEYANNGAAAGAGLAVDSVYRTATGELRVVV
ncbi:MAG TPA: hypothetical protein VGO55_08980 [Allosphingosinicella sp.]|jgi:hypothetical protein|nr:hypothetical protein [Allosphingosinicella sp.]